MAQQLDDGEFWLPSEFLTDDDLLMDFKNVSDLSSPVESVIGSTETESDEDELVSVLTRKMLNSTLQDVSFSTEYTAKGLKLSGSPQSTLCGYKPGSTLSSPNSISRVSSPPQPTTQEAVGWDLLYAAAGEVARIWGTDETTPLRNAKLFAPPPKPISGTVPVKKTNPATGYYPNLAHTEAHLAYLQLQATHFQRMKQQQMMKNSVWGQEKFDYQYQNGKLNGEIGRTQGLSTTAWPTLQQSQQPQPQPQQPGSGMRAVFLGDTVAKKERTGTGVFLPRRFGTNATETRRKPGSTTVLLPEKVVHALNLNLESMDVQPPQRCNRNFTPEYDAALKQRNNILVPQQRKAHMSPQPVMNQELRLPQEWTY